MKNIVNIVFLAHLLWCTSAFAGAPSVSQVEVTDVTPGSFAVAWVASEPSLGALIVLEPDCATPVTGLSLTKESNDATGIIKVTVAGLAADTGYCYQTSTTSRSTSETTLSPPEPATITTAGAVLRTMATETVNTPFANDLLRAPAVYLRSETDAADGMLSVLYLDGGRNPLSLMLKDDENSRYFNLNNLFDATTGSSKNLVGGERVMISERHGISGCVVDRFRQVPADNDLTRARDFVAGSRPQDIDFNGTVNILDVLRVAGSMGTVKGGPCFNDEHDIMGHDRVDRSDLDNVISNFDPGPW